MNTMTQAFLKQFKDDIDHVASAIKAPLDTEGKIALRKRIAHSLGLSVKKMGGALPHQTRLYKIASAVKTARDQAEFALLAKEISPQQSAKGVVGDFNGFDWNFNFEFDATPRPYTKPKPDMTANFLQRFSELEQRVCAIERSRQSEHNVSMNEFNAFVQEVQNRDNSIQERLQQLGSKVDFPEKMPPHIHLHGKTYLITEVK